jgi:antirestriction protein ArdC
MKFIHLQEREINKSNSTTATKPDSVRIGFLVVELFFYLKSNIMTNKKFSVESLVKETLLNGLQKEGLQWFKPWKAGGGHAPINNESGRHYNGINVWILNAAMREHGFQVNEWAPFMSIAKRGGKVKKGSKSTQVYRWNIRFFDVTTKKTYKTEELAIKNGANPDDLRKLIGLTYYNLFNIAQTEGLKTKRDYTTKLPEVEPIQAAEDIIAGYVNKPRISEIEQGRAFYRPATDEVVMPKKGQFYKVDNFYKTLFHELIHSTGHETRLKRKGVTNIDGFGTEQYAMEELIAESGAMMLSGMAGICSDCGDDDTNSQAYVNGWIKAVKSAPEKAIVSALIQSSKAVDYILNL